MAPVQFTCAVDITQINGLNRAALSVFLKSCTYRGNVNLVAYACVQGIRPKQLRRKGNQAFQRKDDFQPFLRKTREKDIEMACWWNIKIRIKFEFTKR